jgi:hypothetical protein
MGIDSWWHLALTIFSSVAAMLIFSAATQGWWFTKNKWWETVLLLVLTFSFFRPGFWWDMIYPAKVLSPGVEIAQVTEQLNVGQSIELRVGGENLEGDYSEKTVRLPFDDKAATAEERISSMGLMLTEADGKMIVDMVEFGSPAEAAGIDFDWEIKSIIQDADRPMKEWVFVPTLLILIGLGMNQRRRARKDEISA